MGKKAVRTGLKRFKGDGNKTHAPSKPIGKNASFHRSGRWAVLKKNGGKWPVAKKVAKDDKASKKAPRFYPGEDVPKPFDRRNVAKRAKLRDSITPGTVLILLAGRFRGKRVVFLKQLESGLLLVTGPFKINGVPLRRINQAFAIATSAEVSVAGIDTSKFDDAYFAKPKSKSVKNADGFFAAETQKQELSADRKNDQKTVDTKILDAVKKTEFMRPYLNARFSLSKGQKPHAMVF
eukprot:CAMPEP_0181311564 /NCGR_PEP_ID=MMETSP1101-20121128/13208_1 /TAXON_ID=46948 /ORGANISM="Rhodomonas abbreviata, Strain Caron Lab Isolate" /LENGTH=235 /DNA_ID=CAMNT_0023418311 /DNA_START=198 /DNA_END=905 /DNA_ORIENTATION=-